MIIVLNNKKGLELRTIGKFCKENIIITPKLGNINTTVIANGDYTYTPPKDNCGLDSVNITVNVPVNEKYPNAEEVSF